MSEVKQKKYVGKGKQAGQYEMVNISIAKSKVEKHWYEYNGEWYLKLTVGKLKEVDQYGKTHSVWVDEFKPDDSKVADTKPSQPQAVSTTDLPF